MEDQQDIYFIIIHGSLLSGFASCGPFATREAAEEYANAHQCDWEEDENPDSWDIMEMLRPCGYTLSVNGG